MGIELSRPGEAGLRGCSGWVVRAAGEGAGTNCPALFSVEKTWTWGSPYLIRERGPVKFFLEIEQKTALLFFTNLKIGAEWKFRLPEVWPIRFFALAIIYGHEGRPTLIPSETKPSLARR